MQVLTLGFGAVAGAAQGDTKFVSGQFRLDVPMPAGRAVLELVAEHAHVDQVHVRLDAQSSAHFRDDGRDLDSRAGDGVFTAVVPADLGRERQTFERLVEGLRRDLPRPVFAGREHVDTIRTSELSKRSCRSRARACKHVASNVIADSPTTSGASRTSSTAASSGPIPSAFMSSTCTSPKPFARAHAASERSPTGWTWVSCSNGWCVWTSTTRRTRTAAREAATARGAARVMRSW